MLFEDFKGLSGQLAFVFVWLVRITCEAQQNLFPSMFISFFLYIFKYIISYLQIGKIFCYCGVLRIRLKSDISGYSRYFKGPVNYYRTFPQGRAAAPPGRNAEVNVTLADCVITQSNLTIVNNSCYTISVTYSLGARR